MQNKSLVTSLSVSLVLAVLPFVLIFFISDGDYPKLPVQITDDSLYYYSRAVDVAKGNVFIGNPYIKENKEEVSPSLFVTDWLWSFPLLLGFSIQTSIIISQIFWFLLFGLFLCYLFKFFDVAKPAEAGRPTQTGSGFRDEKYIPWAIAFVTLCVYWYLARPVAMQVVYPVFLLWLLSFASYLKNPQSRKSIIFLTLATTLSIYTYTYLTQIIAVVFGASLLASFFPSFKIYRSLWVSGILTGLLSIPFLIYVWEQIHNPIYFETIARLGLVNTHMIGTPALFYSALILLSLVLTYLNRTKYSNVQLYLILAFSLGLLVALLSNILTGQDLETAVHIGRFVDLWSVFMLCVFIQKIWIYKHPVLGGYKHWVLGVYIILVIYSFSFQILAWRGINETILSKQVYSESLTWLRTNTPKDSVVLADDSFSESVPIVTDNYVLFAPHATLQTDSNEAMQDRYLASRIFQDLSLEDIKNDMPKYAGNGYSNHRYQVHNRNVKVCKLLRLDLLGKNCGQIETRDSFVGQKYFSDMKSRYDLFKKEPIKTLQKYDVSYIVLDKHGDWTLPESLKPIWSSDRFEIFKL